MVSIQPVFAFPFMLKLNSFERHPPCRFICFNITMSFMRQQPDVLENSKTIKLMLNTLKNKSSSQLTMLNLLRLIKAQHKFNNQLHMHRQTFTISDFPHDRLQHETIYTIDSFMPLHLKLLNYGKIINRILSANFTRPSPNHCHVGGKVVGLEQLEAN